MLHQLHCDAGESIRNCVPNISLTKAGKRREAGKERERQRETDQKQTKRDLIYSLQLIL